jgi:hypothetical protein
MIASSRFFVLLVALLVYFAAAPFFANFPGLRFVTDMSMAVVLLSAVFAVSRVRHQVIITALLAVSIVTAFLMKRAAFPEHFELAANLLGSLFFGYTAGIILAFIVRARRVSADVIYAAIVVYLFIGIFWADVYHLFYQLSPESFSMSPDAAAASTASFTYFSFVTLTTLGYGDISPLGASARSLAVLEAVVGQLYLTVLIARLVGLHISHSSAPR